MSASAGAVQVVPWPTWRDLIGTPTGAARDFGVAAFLAIWVAVIGPFGNYHAGPVEQRVLYHLTLSAAVVAAYRPGIRLGVAAGARMGVGKLISVILSVLAISAPMSIFVSTVAAGFFPKLREILSPLDWYLQLTILVLPIGLAYQLFTGFLGRPKPAADIKLVPDIVSSNASKTASPSRFPVEIGDILALHAEDHYLRVYTSTKTHLLYLSMADALAELDGVDGLQVHRSWWVTRRAVASIVRRGRSAEINLVCGPIAPVARARMADLRAARWL